MERRLRVLEDMLGVAQTAVTDIEIDHRSTVDRLLVEKRLAYLQDLLEVARLRKDAG